MRCTAWRRRWAACPAGSSFPLAPSLPAFLVPGPCSPDGSRSSGWKSWESVLGSVFGSGLLSVARPPDKGDGPDRPPPGFLRSVSKGPGAPAPLSLRSVPWPCPLGALSGRFPRWLDDVARSYGVPSGPTMRPPCAGPLPACRLSGCCPPDDDPFGDPEAVCWLFLPGLPPEPPAPPAEPPG